MSDSTDQIRELLPFWVNGSLDDAERARVNQALAGSTELRAEVAALEALRHRMRAIPQAAGPGDLGLARLMRAIDAESAPAIAPKTAPAMYRLMASVAISAVLSSLVTYTVLQGPGPNAPVYEQASGDDVTSTLTITFQPLATEAAISALLRERGLVIVDGPSAIGLYRIGLPVDMSVEEAARYLAAAGSVIATVEVLE